MRTHVGHDAAATVIAGVGAAWVMNCVTTAFRERQPADAKRREELVSDDVAYAVVVQKAASLMGKRLEGDAAERLGLGFHYAVGVALVPGYVVLRRACGLRPITAGLALGLGASVLVDEVANPVVGSSAPPQDYPLVTHLRGLTGHIAFGLAVPILFESTVAVLRRWRGSL